MNILVLLVLSVAVLALLGPLLAALILAVQLNQRRRT